MFSSDSTNIALKHSLLNANNYLKIEEHLVICFQKVLNIYTYQSDLCLHHKFGKFIIITNTFTVRMYFRLLLKDHKLIVLIISI